MPAAGSPVGTTVGQSLQSIETMNREFLQKAAACIDLMEKFKAALATNSKV